VLSNMDTLPDEILALVLFSATQKNVFLFLKYERVCSRWRRTLRGIPALDFSGYLLSTDDRDFLQSHLTSAGICAFLEPLNALRELNFRGCFHLDLPSLADVVAQRAPLLTSLNLGNLGAFCYVYRQANASADIDGPFLQALSLSCPLLSSLDLTCTFSLSPSAIASLLIWFPSLSFLALSPLIDETLALLCPDTSAQPSTLRSLSLPGCSRLSASALARALTYLPQMVYLDLSACAPAPTLDPILDTLATRTPDLETLILREVDAPIGHEAMARLAVGCTRLAVLDLSLTAVNGRTAAAALHCATLHVCSATPSSSHLLFFLIALTQTLLLDGCPEITGSPAPLFRSIAASHPSALHLLSIRGGVAACSGTTDATAEDLALVLAHAEIAVPGLVIRIDALSDLSRRAAIREAVRLAERAKQPNEAPDAQGPLPIRPKVQQPEGAGSRSGVGCVGARSQCTVKPRGNGAVPTAATRRTNAGTSGHPSLHSIAPRASGPKGLARSVRRPTGSPCAAFAPSQPATTR